MYLVLIAWFYVTLMMAVAEANSPTGTLLGAIMTFVLYGLLPMGILGYIMGTPSRKRAIQAREAQERAAYEQAQQTQSTVPTGHSAAPDAGSQAAAGAEQSGVAPVRKEP
jgi:hypothetical protein